MSTDSLISDSPSDEAVNSGFASADALRARAMPAGATLMHDAIRVRDALELSNRDARNEVELLLMRALDITRARLIAHPELAAQSASNQVYLESLRRRLAGEPIAYILGEREFYGSVFSVSPAVLIPRPETELLVDAALEHIDRQGHGSVLDLGTGSGAIAIAIALQRPNVRVVAVDASQAALDVAITNSEHLLQNRRQLRLLNSDWFEKLASMRFDLIVSNPPYVAAGDQHLDIGDIRFEPQKSLVGGSDGLDQLRLITAQAPSYLVDGGWLLFEHGYDQAAGCRQLLAQAGFVEAVSERDLAGHLRVSGGRWLTGASGTG
jgi:release factor glutamine methyltransferase